MGSISDYKARVSGKSIKSSIETNTIKLLNMNILNSPSYTEVSINDSSPILYGVTIVDDSETKDQKVIASLDYQLQNGDIIDWQGLKWINVITDNLGDIYYRGKLKRCLSSLKWIDLLGDIHEAWFAYNSDSMSNFGLDEGRLITLDNERRNIIFSHNEQTDRFKKEQRFIFDERAWKITAIDKLNPQLITVVLEANSIDTVKDNVELRIANYITSNYELIVDKTSVFLSQTETHHLNVQVKNNGISIPSPILSYTTSDETICTVDGNGLITPITEGNAEITVTYKGLTQVISVVVADAVSHNYTVEIIDSASSNKFTITKTKSKTFTCIFKDNGLEIAMDGVFSLTDVSGSATTLATITSQTTSSCVVRGDGIGYVLLRVSSVDGTVKSSKQIQIKNVI